MYFSAGQALFNSFRFLTTKSKFATFKAMPDFECFEAESRFPYVN
jgi:hypothetical protein